MVFFIPFSSLHLSCLLPLALTPLELLHHLEAAFHLSSPVKGVCSPLQSQWWGGGGFEWVMLRSCQGRKKVGRWTRSSQQENRRDQSPCLLSSRPRTPPHLQKWSKTGAFHNLWVAAPWRHVASVMPSNNTGNISCNSVYGHGDLHEERTTQLLQSFDGPQPLRLPREVVDSPSLEIFKTCLYKVLCSLLWVTLLRQEGWTR